MQRILSISTAAIAAGALAWLAKVAVIVATDGRVTDEGVAAVLFGLGGALLLGGIAGLAVHATRERSLMVRVLAAVAGALALAVSVVVLTVLAGALVPADVPQHLTDEVSTVLASIGWTGVAMSRRRRHSASPDGTHAGLTHDRAG